MKKTCLATIFGISLLCGGFAEETTFGIDYSKLDPQFSDSSYKPDDGWRKYISVSISGLAYRTAVIEFGKWSQFDEDASVLLAFRQAITKKGYSIGAEAFYQQHFNAFNAFQFYSGIGLEGGFYLSKEIPNLLFFTPMISLGKIISASEKNTQFLEVRTWLGHFYQRIANANEYAFAGFKPNYEIYYGVSF